MLNSFCLSQRWLESCLCNYIVLSGTQVESFAGWRWRSRGLERKSLCRTRDSEHHSKSLEYVFTPLFWQIAHLNYSPHLSPWILKAFFRQHHLQIKWSLLFSCINQRVIVAIIKREKREGCHQLLLCSFPFWFRISGLSFPVCVLLTGISGFRMVCFACDFLPPSFQTPSPHSFFLYDDWVRPLKTIKCKNMKFGYTE